MWGSVRIVGFVTFAGSARLHETPRLSCWNWETLGESVHPSAMLEKTTPHLFWGLLLPGLCSGQPPWQIWTACGYIHQAALYKVGVSHEGEGFSCHSNNTQSASWVKRSWNSKCFPQHRQIPPNLEVTDEVLERTAGTDINNVWVFKRKKE